MLRSRAIWSGGVLSASLCIAGALLAQAPSTSTFEVASIKVNTVGPNAASVRFTVLPGGRLTITNIPLHEIIRVAYQIPDDQLIDGPDWILTSRFDIVAKAEGMPALRFPPGLDARSHPVYPMLRALLNERFKLVVHHETRTLPIYALAFARPGGMLGAQLHRSTTDCVAVNAARGRGTQSNSASAAPNGAPPCGMVGSAGLIVRVSGDSQSMSQLVYVLAGYAGHAVVDRTGLTGLFTFTLEFAPDQQRPPDSLSLSKDIPSLFTAVQEQLGLKLESTRGPADVVVIDSVEHPTED